MSNLKPLRIRIVSRDGLTSVYDADTGEQLSAVSIKFEHDNLDSLPTLTLKLNLADVEIETDCETDVEAVVPGRVLDRLRYRPPLAQAMRDMLDGRHDDDPRKDTSFHCMH